MSISSRRWIRWIPSTPTEPTDTIVLTSPGGLFVDVRTILGVDEVATAAIEKSEAELLQFSAEQPALKAADDLHPHQARGRDELAVSWDRLEMATAGKSESRYSEEGRHGTWTHWIDSRGEGMRGAPDTGLMVPYKGEGGEAEAEELTLETGNMVNPATGMAQDYEELWAEVPGQAVGKEPAKLCVVMLALQKAKGKPTGIVIRIGHVCQGVLRLGDKFVVERWVWVVGDGTWKRVVRIGEGDLPCSVVLKAGPELEIGREFKPAKGGHHWRIAELHRS